jgi:hypothetical protein
VPNLITHTCPHIVDTVGDPLGHRQRHDAGREPMEHRGAEVPTVGPDRVPHRNDSRSDMPALNLLVAGQEFVDDL